MIILLLIIILDEHTFPPRKGVASREGFGALATGTAPPPGWKDLVI